MLNCKLNSYPAKEEFSSGSAEFRSICFIVLFPFEFNAAKRGKIPDMSWRCVR